MKTKRARYTLEYKPQPRRLRTTFSYGIRILGARPKSPTQAEEAWVGHPRPRASYTTAWLVIVEGMRQLKVPGVCVSDRQRKSVTRYENPPASLKNRFSKMVRKPTTSASNTCSVLPWPLGAAICSKSTERMNSLMVCLRAEASASSRAYSASLTLVPSDLVRSGGFTTQHRQGEQNSRKETATATATAWDPKKLTSYRRGTRSSPIVTRCRFARPKFLSSKQVRLRQPWLLRSSQSGVTCLSLSRSLCFDSICPAPSRSSAGPMLPRIAQLCVGSA